MRRSDKEITDREVIDRIIADSQVLRVGLSQDDQAYIVPLSFGYDGAAFYFHTALTGRKVEIIAENPQACFELEHAVNLVTHPSTPCEWTFSYQCVMGTGTITELVEPEERNEALVKVMLQYGHGECQFTEKQLAGIKIWKLAIDSITGKQSNDKIL
ncbi:MFS transporter [Geomonas silvestris]|uniref:MFS transporter n=1 Tax=Geomonas silvestris TaxID=2740184 RepID=A0A6V8MEB8_9BACT|nr:pyridoxamine 5'-phosphate oxidase family protein [Geomonas silvestris]GFO58331.1 MFS transporter [Geomonas silvestris]